MYKCSKLNKIETSINTHSRSIRNIEGSLDFLFFKIKSLKNPTASSSTDTNILSFTRRIDGVAQPPSILDTVRSNTDCNYLDDVSKPGVISFISGQSDIENFYMDTLSNYTRYHNDKIWFVCFKNSGQPIYHETDPSEKTTNTVITIGCKKKFAISNEIDTKENVPVRTGSYLFDIYMTSNISKFKLNFTLSKYKADGIYLYKYDINGKYIVGYQLIVNNETYSEDIRYHTGEVIFDNLVKDESIIIEYIRVANVYNGYGTVSFSFEDVSQPQAISIQSFNNDEQLPQVISIKSFNNDEQDKIVPNFKNKQELLKSLMN